jgi:hypothetical protein
MPITPEALNFHSAKRLEPISSNYYLGGGIYEVIDGGAGKVDMVVNDSADSMIIKGTELTLLRFEGLPPNSASAEIKYIFHIEGTPSMNLNTVLVSASEPVVMTDPVVVERTRSKAILGDAIRVLPSIVSSGLSGYASGGPYGALTSMIAKLGL